MTTTPEPVKGVPLLDGNPSLTLRADFNALGGWVRDNVDASVANAAALPSTGNWYGRVLRTADDHQLFFWNGTGWTQMSNGPWLTPTLASGISVPSGYAPPRYRRVPGAVELQGTISGTSGSGYELFTLPGGYRPTGEIWGWATTGQIQITASGGVNSSILGTKTNISFNARFAI